MSINFLNNQPTNGLFGQDFPIMCKLTPANHSFFGSVGFSLLSQISRLQNTAHANYCIQQLEQLIAEGAEMARNQDFYFKKLEEFREIFGYSKNTKISAFLPWLGQNWGESVAYSIRIITFVVLRKLNHQDAGVISDMSSNPTDELGVLDALSQSLMVSFNFYDGNVPKIIDRSQSLINPLLFIGKLNVGEYASLSHKLFENEEDYNKLSSAYPFIQIKHAPTNTGGFVKDMLPSEVQAPKIVSPYSDLIKFIMDFVIVREWKFSIQEKEALLPTLKQLRSDNLYKENASKLYGMIKSNNCEHSHLSFFKFQCGKFHCFDCIREEITLKKLMNFQIFCSCKKPLENKEIDYFFSDVINLSMQNYPSGSNPGNNFPSTDSGLPFTATGVPANMIPVIPTSNSGLMRPGPVPSIPTGYSASIPTGMPSLMNPGIPSGMLTGIPGIPTGIPPSIPGFSSIPSGLPLKPAGFPSFTDNNSLQGVISIPRASFCAKCGVPISPTEIETRGGKHYHRTCKE